MAPLSTNTLRIPSIKTLHKTGYPAISPLRPELSQAGKTVLIAGGSTGIGFAIARGFVQANASRIVLIGRRENVLRDSAAQLAAEAASHKTATTVTPLVCDVADLADTARLWETLKKDGIFVDVLVLNAAAVGEGKPILVSGLASVWSAFEVNVRTLLDFTEKFYKQDGVSEGKKKYLVNVSTSAIHSFELDAAAAPTYGLTKNAGTLLLQQIAKDTDPTDMQIVSFHPGGILTELARSNGITESMYDWDDGSLPSGFAVWAASDEASFVHGRMLAAHWDVDELKTGEARKQIESGWNFLKIGVVGAVTQP